MLRPRKHRREYPSRRRVPGERNHVLQTCWVGLRNWSRTRGHVLQTCHRWRIWDLGRKFHLLVLDYNSFIHKFLSGTIMHLTSPMLSAMATSGTRITTWEQDTVLLTRDTQDVDTWTVLAPSHAMDARSLSRSHSFMYNFMRLLCCSTIK